MGDNPLPHHSCAVPPHKPCTGRSPSHAQWGFAIYPHTGSITVAGYLDSPAQRKSLNMLRGCQHDHRPCVHRSTDTLIAFVANPFRIVLSTAANLGVVAGAHTEMWASKGMHPELTGRSVDQQVAAFRAFVHRNWVHGSALDGSNITGVFSLLSRGKWQEKPTQLYVRERVIQIRRTMSVATCCPSF